MNINKIISLYLSLKLFRSILICLLVLLTIISLIDFSDLYFNSRFKENGSFSRTIIMTFQNIPILIDTLLLYSILFVYKDEPIYEKRSTLDRWLKYNPEY